MKVKIREVGGISFTIPVPLGLLQSRLVAKIAAVAIKNGGQMDVSKEQLHVLLKRIGKCLKSYHRLVLGEVESADGDYVKITL